jgi:AraC family transcriptional activator of pobA
MPEKVFKQIPQYVLPISSPEVSVRYMQLETIIEPSGFQEAHRDQYYLFLFHQTGESKLMVDFEEAHLAGPCVFCILPGQVHHYLTKFEVTGWLIAVNAVIIDKSFTTYFEGIARLIPLRVEPDLAELFTHTLIALQASCRLEENSMRYAITSHLVSAYAGLIVNVYKRLGNDLSAKTGRPFEITKDFRAMVRENHPHLKRPAQYAEKLHITTSYLNECVKSVTGMPISYWIQEESVLEAKRLLYYNKLSIKEIAFKLGYNDEAYFSRLFLKVTGMTPAKFRNSHV